MWTNIQEVGSKKAFLRLEFYGAFAEILAEDNAVADTRFLAEFSGAYEGGKAHSPPHRF